MVCTKVFSFCLSTFLPPRAPKDKNTKKKSKVMK